MEETEGEGLRPVAERAGELGGVLGGEAEDWLGEWLGSRRPVGGLDGAEGAGEGAAEVEGELVTTWAGWEVGAGTLPSASKRGSEGAQGRQTGRLPAGQSVEAWLREHLVQAGRSQIAHSCVFLPTSRHTWQCLLWPAEAVDLSWKFTKAGAASTFSSGSGTEPFSFFRCAMVSASLLTFVR